MASIEYLVRELGKVRDEMKSLKEKDETLAAQLLVAMKTEGVQKVVEPRPAQIISKTTKAWDADAVEAFLKKHRVKPEIRDRVLIRTVRVEPKVLESMVNLGQFTWADMENAEALVIKVSEYLRID